MRQQTVIALAVAIVLGLVAVFLANMFLTGQQREAAAGETTKIAVAAIPLDYGVVLTPDKVRFIDYPVQSLPPGSFRSVGELLPEGKSRAVLRPMAVNEPILASKLTGEGQGASLAALLPDGMRAVSVRIDDVSGVAGFVQPNDAVDVLVTRRLATGNQAVQVTDVLLQDTKVLAMGAETKGADGTAKPANTATLQVDPLDAQKLALAQEIGNLSLVLCRPGEEQNSAVVATVSLDDLRYGRSAARPYTATPLAATNTVTRPRATVTRAPRRTVQRAPAAPAPPRTSNVEVVRGTENSSYEVGRYDS